MHHARAAPSHCQGAIQKTKQKGYDAEIANAEADAAREKMLFETSPELFLRYMTVRYSLS